MPFCSGLVICRGPRRRFELFSRCLVGATGSSGSNAAVSVIFLIKLYIMVCGYPSNAQEISSDLNVHRNVCYQVECGYDIGCRHCL